MEIKIKVEGEDPKSIDLILSDDELNNNNFVSLIIEDKEYLVSVEDLHLAVLPFLVRMDREKELNN